MEIKYKLYDSSDCLVVDLIHTHGSYHCEFVHLSEGGFEDAVLALAKEIRVNSVTKFFMPRGMEMKE
jgi:hypothetical protein